MPKVKSLIKWEKGRKEKLWTELLMNVLIKGICIPIKSHLKEDIINALCPLPALVLL